MLFSNLLNHYVETTSLCYKFYSPNFDNASIQCMLTLLSIYLNIWTNFKTEDNTEDFPVDEQD